MKGSISWQVIEIFKEVREIGSSKYDAKNTARENGAIGSAGISRKTGIYSYRTSDAYRENVINFAKWAKENAGLKDLTKTSGSAVKAYLDSKISDGIAHKTFQQVKASLNKFEVALNKYSAKHNLNKTYDFRLNVTYKNTHKNLEHADVRAYNKATVDKVLNIQDKAVNLAVRLALSAGLRKSEILKLSISNLKENKIEIIGSKGGKDRIVSQILDKSLIQDLKAFMMENNIQKLGQAIPSSKINYEIRALLGNTGSIHALRHNYAINLLKDLEAKGYSHVEAVHATSLQLGHNRTEIINKVYSK